MKTNTPSQKAPKPKASKWLHFTQATDPGAYTHLTDQLAHHDDLEGAQIRLAWMIDNSADTDGHLVLGKCVKAPEIWQHLTQIDFVIGLNQEWWQEADKEQRAFLVDHELCHAAPSIDGKTGEQKIDDQGFLQWRIRKHDLEEFFGPVDRHGLRLSNLYRFYEVLKKAQATLPFSFTGADVESIGA